jgi:acyl carrier protein
MADTPYELLRQQIRRFVVDSFLFGQDELADDESFMDGGVLDSTGVLQLVGFVESTFAISVADEELVPANLDSVRCVASYVQRKLAAPGGPATSVYS